MQKTAHYFGLTNLAIGALGFTGPVVTGNYDEWINLHSGKLPAGAAINPLHALLHAGWGVYGLAARNTDEQSLRYMRATAGVFGVLSLVGRARVRGQEDIQNLLGLALNREAN